MGNAHKKWRFRLGQNLLGRVILNESNQGTRQQGRSLTLNAESDISEPTNKSTSEETKEKQRENKEQ